MLVNTYTVAELTTYIRELFETNEQLQEVWVSGEVSNMTRAASGHWYFTLKDEKAQLKCVMWRSSASRQITIPQNGDALEVHGYISVYEPRGEYQLYADRIQPVGVGDLYQRFEELKAQLAAEGLFDEERKRQLPAFPRQIGVVTSPDAAAFQDIQNVLWRRFPLAEVILSPTPVQGLDAPPQIVAAIERLNAHTQVDVILVCRGGGSIEDLWAFNSENVARAVAASRIPTVSGVGHETDFTIVDFVTDVRAPTPSAAAEIATPDSAILSEDLLRLNEQMTLMSRDILHRLRSDLDVVQHMLERSSPLVFIDNMRQSIDSMNAGVISNQRQRIALLRERLSARKDVLNAANPQAILSRGYALVYRSDDGVQVRAEQDAAPGTGITIKLRDGELKARVEDKESHERYKRTLF